MGLKRFVKNLRGSFSLKVFLYFISFLLFFFATYTIMDLYFHQKALEEDILKEGKSLVRILADNSRLGIFSEDKETLHPIVNSVLGLVGVVEACVLTADWRMLCRHELGPAGPVPVIRPKHKCSSHDASFREEMKASPSFKIVYKKHALEFWRPVYAKAAFTPDELHFGGTPATDDDQTRLIGYVELTMDKKILLEKTHVLIARSAVLITVFLLLGAFATYFIARMAMAPLTGLIEKIKNRGDLPESAQNEMELLTDTFDNMVSTLSESFETITSLKDGLEEKVRKRTAELSDANQQLAERQERLEKTNKDLAHAIKELQKAQTQMVQTEKMAALGSLVSGLSHEVNNTNNFITSALPPFFRRLTKLKSAIKTVGLADIELPETTDPDLETTYKQGEDLTETIRDIDILYNSIETGADRTRTIMIDLANFVSAGCSDFSMTDIHENLDSLLSLLRQEAKDGIEILTEYQPDLGTVIINQGELNQVFMNIMRNAIEAIGGQGRIVIRTRADNGTIHVFIRDTGRGISSENIGRIFDPFFTTKGVGEGFGLGLSICYQIIAKMGGDILVQSEEGKGTEFEIIFPRSQHDVKPPPHNLFGGMFISGRD